MGSKFAQRTINQKKNEKIRIILSKKSKIVNHYICIWACNWHNCNDYFITIWKSKLEIKKRKMNKIKTKYNSLSKNEKVIYLSVSLILTTLVINQFYNAGEAIGTAFYNFTH